MMEMLGILVLFIVCLVLSSFFSGYETSFVTANRLRVKSLSEKSEEPSAKPLLEHMEQPDNMLTMLLLGNNIVLIVGTIALTRELGSFWAALIATPTYLIFGEILPKTAFRMHPTRLALRLFPLVGFFERVLLPFTYPISGLSRRILGNATPEGGRGHTLMRTPEDMRVLVDESAEQGAIAPEEQEMIHSVMDLPNRLANEVMVPRIRIQALPETATRRDLLELFKNSGKTRIPIYHETVDKISGVANAFDLLKDSHPEDESITRFVRGVLHVHDTIRLDDLLAKMRAAKQSMAIVTDEFGGTDGLITLEDVLEEIFGEIRDEYDAEETSIRKVGPNAWIVDARAPLEDLAKALGVSLADEEVETVGGWLMHVLARIPQKGEVNTFDQFRVIVIAGGPNYIARIRLELLEAGKTPPPTGKPAPPPNA